MSGAEAGAARGRLARWWEDWEAFWDEREHPIAMALVRIGIGLCLTYDFAYIRWLGLVKPLYAVMGAGGMSDAAIRENPALMYRILPGELWVANAHHGIMLACSFLILIGLFTRPAIVVLIAAWAQFAMVLPYSDRGIDTLLRLALVILFVSPSHRTLSVDAWLRTRSFLGDGAPELAIGRRLLIGQLVLMYFGAGTQKIGITWWPMGHYAALHFALQDPAVAAWDFSFTARQPYFLLTQLGSIVTMLKQYTYPVVLPMLYWKRNPGTGGRLGAFCVRWHLHWIWIVVGFVFHVILGLTMHLGIFPWAMLSLYPVWVRPELWVRLFRRLGIPL